MAVFDPRRFAQVLRLPGAAKFSSAGFLARIPLSGATLAITLAVVDQRGSFADAGLLVAAFAIARALGAPPLSRIVDRYGQFAVMLLATMVQLVLLGVLTAGIFLGWNMLALAIVAALAGFGSGSPPAFVRARWAHIAPDTGTLGTAFSWEALVESAAFTVAPLIIVCLVDLYSPFVGLSFVVVLVGIAGLCLYTQRGTQPPPTRARGERERIDRRAAGIVLISALYYFSASFAMGALDIIAVSQGEAVSIPAFTGIVIAVCSLGKMVGAISYGSLQWRITPQQRLQWIIPLFALLTLAVPLSGGSAWLILAAFLIGPLYSAALTSSNLIVQSVVPRGRLTEQLAWLFAAFGLGVAFGTFAAGLAVELGGFTAAATVFVASGCLALATLGVDLLLRRRLVDRHQLAAQAPHDHHEEADEGSGADDEPARVNPPETDYHSEEDRLQDGRRVHRHPRER